MLQDTVACRQMGERLMCPGHPPFPFGLVEPESQLPPNLPGDSHPVTHSG